MMIFPGAGFQLGSIQVSPNAISEAPQLTEQSANCIMTVHSRDSDTAPQWTSDGELMAMLLQFDSSSFFIPDWHFSHGFAAY